MINRAIIKVINFGYLRYLRMDGRRWARRVCHSGVGQGMLPGKAEEGACADFAVSRRWGAPACVAVVRGMRGDTRA
jgi:hypothetical protein